MNIEIFERLAIAILITSLAGLAYLLFNRLALKRAESKVGQFETYRPGLPALVYFTTPTCAPCKTVQRPAIQRLIQQMGQAFQVIEIDASRQPEVAQAWGVVSVPTTFVIDRQGRPRYVNHGVVSAEKLLKQLELEDYVI
jgi:thiol-disulfide isomerase/thioredoxin